MLNFNKLILIICIIYSFPSSASTKNILNSSDICIIEDLGISGRPVAYIYTNKVISCELAQKLYTNTFISAYKYLFIYLNLNKNLSLPKKIDIKIINLSELNDPRKFIDADKECMTNIKCSSGAYLGRTYYSYESNNITTYIAGNTPFENDSEFSLYSTLKHELMHIILFRYGIHDKLNEKQEHILIKNYLKYSNTN